MALFYERILGSPFFYDRIRPLVFGGLSFPELYEDLASRADSVIVDVGCGTGTALAHLGQFAEYHGFDIDGRALRVARQRYGQRPNVTFYERPLTAKDLAVIHPTRAILMGLLHHLSDPEARSLLTELATSGTIDRVVTLDPARMAGKWLNNVLCWLDRGKYVRDAPRYRALAEQAGLTPTFTRWLRSGNRLGTYYVMTLAPPVSER